MLTRGMRDDNVLRWQGFVTRSGHPCGAADGDFGGQTEAATKAYQAKHGLTVSGVADAATLDHACRLGFVGMIPFLQARNFTPRGKLRVDLVVIHTMEAPEGPKTAANVAGWFASQPKDGVKGTSCEYNVDATSIVQSVRERDRAWHAGRVNPYAIGIEHAGYARQSPAEWRDPYSEAMIRRSARLCADICARYGIPLVLVSPEGLVRGKRGITTHANVSLAWPPKKNPHWDPGPHFPFDDYLRFVESALQDPAAADTQRELPP